MSTKYVVHSIPKSDFIIIFPLAAIPQVHTNQKQEIKWKQLWNCSIYFYHPHGKTHKRSTRCTLGKKKKNTDQVLNLFSFIVLWSQSTFWVCKCYGSTVSLKLECNLYFLTTRNSAVSHVLTGKFSWENIHFQSIVFILSDQWSYGS